MSLTLLALRSWWEGLDLHQQSETPAKQQQVFIQESV